MSGTGVVSMITGILSMILCWTGLVGVALGVVAIVFFCMSRKAKKTDGMAVAGLVTGILGLACSLIWALIYTIIIGAGVAA